MPGAWFSETDESITVMKPHIIETWRVRICPLLKHDFREHTAATSNTRPEHAEHQLSATCRICEHTNAH